MKKKITATMLAMTFVFGLAWAKAGEVRLEAVLTASASNDPIKGKAQYRERNRRQFSVEVAGFQPGDRFDVMISGAVVGTVTIDDFGVGDLNYDSNFEPGLDDPSTKFPPNFPALDGGELVVVGPLSGTLQRR